MTKEMCDASKGDKAKNEYVIRKCKAPGGWMCYSAHSDTKPKFGHTPQEALSNYLEAEATTVV